MVVWIIIIIFTYLEVKVSQLQAMRAQMGALLILKLGVKIVVVGRRKTQCTLPPENRAGTHCTGGRVDLRAGLDSVEKRKYLAPQGFQPRNVHPIAI